ncbi:lytic transglycosylase domain-containing protein [Reichenbachiella versicolor]|uniref:lytic transglycosylase domain-containing protein n=1 Tax=Reichenbachiella versicolor TaxID=1821036 RepID=UPI000D6DF346|nr:lytic transglycosylase domain-containing protein [Reichenbachiella versicolor]
MRKVFHILIVLFGSCLIVFSAEKKEKTIDFTPDVSYDLLADRITCIKSDIPLVFNDKVQSFIDYFTVRNRPYTKEFISNSEVFFPIFEEKLAAYGIPDELKYLAIVESGLRPNAISRAGAGGLWQFMPSTGKSYGLKQSWYIDERMDPWKATEAACKYLKMLYNIFGDWELALAAYNTGPGNVRKAIRRSGYKKTFWEIYPWLPRETRSYVPQFVAVVYTMKYREEHYFFDNEITNNYLAQYDTLHLDGYIHMETLANQLDLCVDQVIKLNPQVIRGATPDGTNNFPLKLPIDKIEYAKANRITILDSASKVGKKELAYLARNTPGSTYGRARQIYRVRSGDVLGSIAQRYHVRVSDIKRWNNLHSNMIRVGQRLNIWTLPIYNSSTKNAYAVKYTKPKPQPKPEPKEVSGGTYHQVRSGESLWSIAKLYKDVSIEQIKKLNNLNSSRIDPGQRLLISM